MKYVKFCQKYGIIWSFAKNMELYEVLSKIWKYVKFCQKYGIIWNFAKNIKLCFSFAKYMELCQVLPKIWSSVKFCPSVQKPCLPNAGLCQPGLGFRV
jgi:hypothetical protein